MVNPAGSSRRGWETLISELKPPWLHQRPKSQSAKADCHPERSEGPMESARGKKMHRSFASLKMTMSSQLIDHSGTTVAVGQVLASPDQSLMPRSQLRD